jgi:hypothetical protein
MSVGETVVELAIKTLGAPLVLQTFNSSALSQARTDEMFQSTEKQAKT